MNAQINAYVGKTEYFKYLFLKMRPILDWLMSSSKLASLGCSNHHSYFFHGVIDTIPGIPIDPFAIISVPIFPVKICPVTCVIRLRSMIFCYTVTPSIIAVIFVCGEVHSVMFPHTVS